VARIRSIKPEFWTNERVMECSLPARLLFIGMWNFADDLGRMALAPRTIKAQVLPGDDISSDNILGMIEELSKSGLILLYEVDGREYIQIVGWQHQRIDKPQPGKCPGPVNGYSKTIRGMVATEWKGKEGKVKEEISVPSERAPSAPPLAPDPDKELFSRGKQILGKSAGGLIAKLKAAKGGNIALARAAIEQASTKQNPGEYIAGVIRGGVGPPAFPERVTNGFATRLARRRREEDEHAGHTIIDVTPNQSSRSDQPDKGLELIGGERFDPSAGG
jgi:hypothetical protein